MAKKRREADIKENWRISTEKTNTQKKKKEGTLIHVEEQPCQNTDFYEVHA